MRSGKKRGVTFAKWRVTQTNYCGDSLGGHDIHNILQQYKKEIIATDAILQSNFNWTNVDGDG